MALHPAHHAHAQGESFTVQITGMAQPPGFAPALLTLHIYDSVVFVNHAIPATTYAITADDGSFSSPAIAPGDQWSTIFVNVGTHEYHESSSIQHMSGELVIVSNAVSLLPTPQPEVMATAIADIRAGNSPPNVITLPTTTTDEKIKQMQITPSELQVPFLVLMLGLFLVLLMQAGIVFAVALYFRRKGKSHDLRPHPQVLEQPNPLESDDSDDQAEHAGKTRSILKKLAFFHSSQGDEEEQEDDDEDYDE
jgi:hypothetical protein